MRWRLGKNSQIERVLSDLILIQALCTRVVGKVNSFEVADAEALPFGLKPHTRSVSWLVEQVLTQRFKLDAEEMGLGAVEFEYPDTALHDLTIEVDGRVLPINVKVHQAENKPNKNDISAVEKLYKAYSEDPNYNLYYSAFGIKFEGRNIVFIKDKVHCFSPQFLPIYVNPRNDKIQAFYHHVPEIRSRGAFLKGLSAASTSIQL